MKIGIITCWKSLDNYGQQLQCWAFQKVLGEMGQESFLIRFSSRPARIGRAQLLKERLKRIVHFTPREFLSKAARRLGLGDASVLEGEERVARVMRRNAERDFEGFRRRNMALSPAAYGFLSELKAAPPEADCYITGSDQVWYDSLGNPDNEDMYLNFGDGSVRRVSYAASIGREIIPSEWGRFSELVNALDFVSVREQSAADTCARAGVDASVAVDPTLLLDRRFYDGLIASGPGPAPDSRMVAGHLLAYVVNVPDAGYLHWDRAAAYACAVGAEPVAVYSSGYLPAREMLDGARALYPTVPEWLRLVRDARCVVTTSFHGAAFSVVFHRPFLAMPLGAGFERANDRLATLLEDLGLGSRIYIGERPFAEAMDAPIDRDAVDQRLEVLRARSLAFLERALA